MENNENKKLNAWNPLWIGILGLLFSFLPAGVFYAINYERLGHPGKKNSSLILVILGFIVFSIVVFISSQYANLMPLFILINAAVSGYFFYSQRTLYKQYLDSGRKPAPNFLPAIISIIWFVFVNVLILSLSVNIFNFEDPKAIELYEVVKRNNIEEIQRLLSEGTDINAELPDGSNILHQAVRYSDLETVKFLIENGADVNFTDDEGYTAFMIAVMREKADVIKFLLKKGANVNSQNKYGETALLLAVDDQHADSNIARVLIENGADVNTKNMHGYTPLMWAAYWMHYQIAQDLLNNGAKVNSKDNYGKTPLLMTTSCSIMDKLPMIKLLVDNGADVNVVDNDKHTPLMNLIINYNNPVTVLYLLEKDVDINATDYTRNSILMKAVENFRYETVEKLIEKGVDLNAKNSNGETALTIANKNGYQTLATMLDKSGAK